MAKQNLPALQFYGGDWRKDPGVQSLNYFDRGVWFEMLLMMHESEDRGKLLLNGRPVPNDALARMLGLDMTTLENTLRNIFAMRVASRDPDTQAIMNRRMVRDEAVRRARSEAGKKSPTRFKPGGRERAGESEPEAETNAEVPICPSEAVDTQTVSDRSPSGQTDGQNVLSGNGPEGDLSGQTSGQKPVSTPASPVLSTPPSGQIAVFEKGAVSRQIMEATSSSSLGSSEPVKPIRQGRGRLSETWIDPLFCLSAEQYGKIEVLAVEYWPEMNPTELGVQIQRLLTEFVDYWLEQARIDKQNPGVRAQGKKASWYMTFRNRVQAVGVAVQRRRASNIVRQRQDAGDHDDSTGNRPYESAAERNARLLKEQETYLNGLPESSGEPAPADAVGLQLDPEDFG